MLSEPSFHPPPRRSNSDLPNYLAPLHRQKGERGRAREKKKEEEMKAGLQRAGSFGSSHRSISPLKSISPPKSRAPRRLQKIQSAIFSAPANMRYEGTVKGKGWISAPPPPNNAERVKKLQSYNILDTPPELSFDDITKIAASVCGVPMATLSFVDDTRQFFKSRLGVDVTGTPIDQALCAHTIIDVNGFMEIKDTKKDQRFYGNPQVTGDVGLRFYAGAALITPDNQALGALCALDKKPRELDEQQVAAMKALARLVVDQLEARAKNLQLIDMSNKLQESQRKLEELNAELMAQNSVLKSQITELHGKKPEIELNAPVAKVVDLLSKIQESMADTQQKILLQDAINIIASQKLYDVDVEEAIAAGTNVDAETKGFLLTQLDSPSMKETIWENSALDPSEEFLLDGASIIDEETGEDETSSMDIETILPPAHSTNGQSTNGQTTPRQTPRLSQTMPSQTTPSFVPSKELVKSSSTELRPPSSARKFSIVAVPKGGVDPNEEMSKVAAVLEGVGALTANIDDWDFDIFKFTEATRQPLFYSTLTMLYNNDFLRKLPIPASKLISFLTEVESGYNHNHPYHNNIHASDVMLSSNFFAKATGVMKHLTPAEHLALLIAAAVHDLGHLGVNNAFLVSTAHEVAIAHNDKSVQENFHCVQAFKLLYNTSHDFLLNLSLAERQEIRKMMIELVLATDMSQHVEIFNTFQNKRQAKEGFDLANNKQDRLLVMKMIIKCADISNSAKRDLLYKNWANRVMEEFWSQGDQERKLGLPISAFMDRTQADVPKCQSGFIQFIALPVYTAMVEQFPDMAICVANMKENLNYWKTQ